MVNNPSRLRISFVITSMPVGGAETLLVNLVREARELGVESSICCLKEPGPLGEMLAGEMPVASHLIRHKYDWRVLGRLGRAFREHQADAVVTVGAGDKMFWGRLAARWVGVPVILSALHSTGWPDGVGRLNRWLTPITDGFIAVATHHGQYLVEQERFPADKVHVIANGIDTQRFQPNLQQRDSWRQKLKIDAAAPVVGIVAALRPEKDHLQFVDAAAIVNRELPQAHFLIAGDGPTRGEIEARIAHHQLQSQVHLLGNVSDIPGLLTTLDLFSLTSKNEASPVSIMEALACEVPVVAPTVGSIAETVIPGETGHLVPPGNAEATAAAWLSVLRDPTTGRRLGQQGRQRIAANHSLRSMTTGYVELIERILARKRRVQPASVATARPQSVPNTLRATAAMQARGASHSSSR
jgi:glycosyltransferase involved in cell wall biosynthesis